MKRIIPLFVIACFCGLASARDATFESSDGLWTDRTVEKKGRNFYTILWGFESYKLKQNKPGVTLVRVTSEPDWGKRSSKKERSDPKWKVPYMLPSGKAKHPIPSYTVEERDEIKKRADKALEYWKNKAILPRRSKVDQKSSGS